eukprot:g7540.t1
MFNGESKKRPTVSLRGKSKEEDRGEFLRRARAQREGRARERLHVSSATTIQRVWRGRSCVGKWRREERDAWDRKMHDVGRVKAMLSAAGKTLQLPPAVLVTLLSQLVSFHAFPHDAGRFRAAIDLVLAAAPPTDAAAGPPAGPGGAAAAAAAGGGLFAPPPAASSDGDRSEADNAWSLLVARLATVCLHYIGQVAAGGSATGAAEGGDVKGNTGDADGRGAAVVVGVGSSEVAAASEAALRGFGLLASPRAWEHRWPGSRTSAGGVGATSIAESRCRALMSSLALGRITFSGAVGGAVGGGRVSSGKTPLRRNGGDKGDVRLSVRAERDELTGEWTRAPRLFGVLRVVWDASASTAAAGGAAGADAPQAVRLLCSSSFKALGIGGAKEGASGPGAGGGAPPPSGGVGGAVVHNVGGGVPMPTERQRLLEAFAAAVLPAPRLLDHPLRTLLVDPMLAGDAGAWWQLVSVAGGAVGGNGGSGGDAARRRDVAWAVANILRVDTGGSADRAPCLVRTLCALLRKVSLHALLQGAGKTERGDAGGSGLHVDSAELDDDDDDDDIVMEEAFSVAAADRGGPGVAPSGGGGGGGARPDDDFAVGGIRLESIVRHHRRRCAVRTEALAAEQLSPPGENPSSRGPYSSGSKRHAGGGGTGGGGVGGRERAAAAAMVSGEVEAMAAAAERLADPVVVGRLFDSILPPIARFSAAQQQTDGSPPAVTLEAQSHPVVIGGGGDGGDSRGGPSTGDVDPVLALCSLYADLVMDGVRAGSSAAAAAGGTTSAGSSAAGDAKLSVSPGKSVLNALAFGRPKAPIAARLWAYLQRRQDLRLYAKGEGGAGGTVQSALFLFCSACSHQLLALDDEEFYEKQRPLTLEEVRQLAGFLRDWLCRLYWLDPVIPRLLEDSLSSDATHALRQCEDRLREALLLLSATRLFNQLYERNTRRSFLDAEAWYWKAISANELSPPDRGDPRVAFFSRGNLGMVLTNIPQVVPFFQRVGIFRQMIEAERGEHQGSSAFNHSSSRIRVSRETLYEDSAEELTKLGSALKGRIQVTFMNQHGVEEAGIDGGGVFKEYMDLLTKRAFDPQYALFLATEDQYLFPNPAASMVTEDYLFHFEFLGRVLAKAVFEDILVEPQFSPVFLNKLLGRYNYIDDLYSLDPELYRNLMQLKAIVQSGGDVADLCLTFSASTSVFGETKLNLQTARPCKAFLQGFRDLIPVEWIRLFNPQELQRLIGGEGGRAIDVQDLKRNTLYAGGYHQSQPVMQWFWEAIESFSPEEQGQFLKFVTSCSRPPLLGFGRLNPPICLQRVPEGEEGRLPSSATCMNLLKLPQYADRQTLRQKLLYAISANAGFELT